MPPPPPPAEDERNSWQELLEKSSSAGWGTAKVRTSTLVVLGDRMNGKTSVLSKFVDRVSDSKNPSEFILDFSYINARNRFNLDKDEIVSRMKVWQLDDRNHWPLLAKLIPEKELSNAVFVITVDLSKPWEVLSSLEKWLEVVKQTTEKISSQLPAEEQASLKKKISSHVQLYAAESAEKKAEAAAPSGDAAEAKAVVIDDAVPKVNFGVPLIIVGTKGDYYSRVIAKTSADEKFEHVVRRLRTVALDHGAGLLFTSAFGEGANIQVLQDYIYTRALGLPQNHAPKVVGVATDFSIFVPSGFDNAQLLATKVSGRSGWTDTTPLSEIFAENYEAKKKPDARTDTVVTADDNDTFFKSLRDQVAKGVPFSKLESSPPPPPPPKDKKQQLVTSFFNNLLNKPPA
jgi:dynein light intermediate chain 1